MPPYSDTRSTTHNMPIPSATTVTDTPTDPDQLVIREDIINPLSEGDHHAAADLPTESTVLPPRDGFQDALEAVQTYLYSIGCGIIADAHLRGLSAVVHTTDAGEVYAYIDEGLLYDIIEATLQDTDNVSDMNSDAIGELADAAVLAHQMEFQASMQEHGVNAEEAASWAEGRGQTTSSPTGIVFSTPHPVTTLDQYVMLPERGIAMVAGIQHMTADFNGVYGQRDIAAVYLHGYLTAHGLTHTQATSTVSNWYDIPPQCLTSLMNRFEEDVEANGYPVDEPEFRYYLTDAALTELPSQHAE